MHMFNDLFSSPFKPFKPYQDHFCVRVVHCVVPQISPKKRTQSFTFQSRFQLSDLEIVLFLRIPTPSFLKPKCFWTQYNRLFYSCGLLIAFFQIS